MDDRTEGSRYCDLMRQAFLWALLPTLVQFLAAPSLGYAQVVTTNITPSGLGTEVPLEPPPDGVYNITGGYRPGGGLNLFHSFGDFSVGSGDIANFLNDANMLTSNIISRVTEPGVAHTSYIYGTIQTTGFDIDGLPTNFFLVNPNGIVFGPNGSVNVGGSVSFSTAQYLRLSDGVDSANFYASPANDGQANSILVVDPVVNFGFLSTAVPAAYGFLTAPDPSATITVQGSTLAVPEAPPDTPPNSISLVGGKVVIEGGAQLSAPSGRIHLATTASPGEFAAFEPLATATSLQSNLNNPVDPASATSFTSYGLMSLAPGSSIDVSGTHTVWIKGGQLVLSVNDATLTTASEGSAASDTVSLNSGSSIVTSNFGTEPGADVQITVGSLSLDGFETAIATGTVGEGNGGNLTANVGTLSLTNGAKISSDSSFASGQGGNVTVQGLLGPGSAANKVTLDNSGIKTETSFGLGQGGDISISAQTMDMNNFSEVRTVTFIGDAGGGDLSVNVGRLTLTGSSVIQSQAITLGIDLDGDGVFDVESTGDGGDVTIQGISGAGNAAESVVLSGASQILSETLDGNGGRLSIAATSVNLNGASIINSSTFGLGHGGDIEIAVQNASLTEGATLTSSTGSFAPPGKGVGGTITVHGLDGQETMAHSITLTGLRSGIIIESNGSALPGAIEVHAKAVNLTDGAVIEGGNVFSEATGGKVTINADSVSIASGSHISSQARFQNAGPVTITANQLTLNNGSIVTTTKSELGGRGGDVVLDVGAMSMTNGASVLSQTEPFSNGRAGDITITAGQSVTLTNGSSISASSSGTGNAGNITVQSGSTVVMNNSSITTEASQASGGQIEIIAPEIVHLINSEISTSVAGSDADTSGGDISIDPQFVVLQNSQILAQAFAGTGGNITIVSNVFLADPNSLVDASSQLGVSGEVNIQSPLQNIGGELTALSQEFSSAAALLAQQCAARVADGKFSTFVVAAREGLPVEPGGFLASPSLTSELLGSGLSGLGSQPQFSAAIRAFPKYDAKPIQLAKLGSACR